MRSETPEMRGSCAAACGVPAFAPSRTRSWNTVPAIEERVILTLALAVLSSGVVSMPPVFTGSTFTDALLFCTPPAG